MSCPICCESFNQRDRLVVECGYCALKACRGCVQRYLTSIVDDPHCMQCKNAWNREFIDQACTKTFRNNELKKHRENILFEREKCLLPEAQQELVRRREIARLLIEKDTLYQHIRNSEMKLLQMQREIFMLRHPEENRTAATSEEKKTFVRKCPVTDCRGFLSSRWKCDLCKNYVCPDCNEIKNGDDHVCDPNAVETINLLKKDTKPCVKCGTMIFKISGCSQMWCPDCHTAFDWNTGKVATGVIHNPHFYDFQRQHGKLERHPADVQCGGMPNYYQLAQSLGTRACGPLVMQVHRFTLHVIDEELPRYAEPRGDATLDMRLEYLQNHITEERFKQRLQQYEKRREKKRDIRDILTMFTQTSTDIFAQIFYHPSKADELAKIFVELRAYTNETLGKIGSRYTCKVPYITETWEFF